MEKLLQAVLALLDQWTKTTGVHVEVEALAAEVRRLLEIPEPAKGQIGVCSSGGESVGCDDAAVRELGRRVGGGSAAPSRAAIENADALVALHRGLGRPLTQPAPGESEAGALVKIALARLDKLQERAEAAEARAVAPPAVERPQAG